ncbi:Protein piccolo [Colletotrichum spinosum]|uniref:Protein piccolo n=1 Tax=Colletotrichum spinosum TaxID=1347390 RepID=A0A4R8QFA2_9PEZI|nr:Protein piccolo [Colletotrichum spinosum]
MELRLTAAFGRLTRHHQMQLNKLVFPDNSKIETFSQTQRQVIVNQNPNPLPASHVVGSTGQPFVQLSRSSFTIQTNGATDLVGAQIELPIDQNMLTQAGVTADNTYVAMLSRDRQAWIIMEGAKSVNITDATVRMVKLNQIDGEYVAVGRQTSELGTSLTPFGQPINIAGSGIQEAEFQDGFRMSIRASQPMSIKTDVVNGISTEMVTNGIMSINNYRYLVTSNLAGVVPSLNTMTAVVQMPLNVDRLMAMAMRAGASPQSSITLGIAQRPVLQNPGGATGGLQAPRVKRQNQNQDVNNGTSNGGPNTGNGNGAGAVGGAAPAAGQNPQNGGNNNNPPQGQNPQPNQGGPTIPAATQLLLAQTFSPINAQVLLDRENARIAVPVNQIDGEFILTMMVGGTPVGTQPQPPAPQQGQPGAGGGITGQPQAGTQPQPQPQAPRPAAPPPPPQQPAAAEPQQPRPAPPAAQPQPQQPQQQPQPQPQPQQPAQTQPQGPPTGGGITGNQPGPGGGAITGGKPNAPPPGRPARRQEEQAAPPPGGGFEMKMSDLMAMAETRKNGGVMATWEMMTNFVAQQKSEEQQKAATKRRREFPVRRRVGEVHF